ncbi:MAG: NADP transhydrogenase subunit alpha, partial [Coprothermobacterota bacterium]|nr:NADP transhydrogenase subunit alpha [Coprothermobacterota bacterium]
VTYSSLGKMLGVPTPVSDALTVMTCTLNATDYWKEGRTVEMLGLDPNWSLEQLQTYLYEGTVAEGGE